jgi:GcrA cell cycle regulator
MSWTHDRVASLKELWASGCSASQIAESLGNVTRNGVISKVHRLGLASRRSGPESGHKNTSQQEQEKQPVVVETRVLEPAPVEPGPEISASEQFVTVLTVTERMCHWPMGDPCTADFHYCGMKSKPRSSYCEAHARTAYEPRKKRRAWGGELSSLV